MVEKPSKTNYNFKWKNNATKSGVNVTYAQFIRTIG